MRPRFTACSPARSTTIRPVAIRARWHSASALEAAARGGRHIRHRVRHRCVEECAAGFATGGRGDHRSPTEPGTGRPGGHPSRSGNGGRGEYASRRHEPHDAASDAGDRERRASSGAAAPAEQASPAQTRSGSGSAAQPAGSGAQASKNARAAADDPVPSIGAAPSGVDHEGSDETAAEPEPATIRIGPGRAGQSGSSFAAGGERLSRLRRTSRLMPTRSASLHRMSTPLATITTCRPSATRTRLTTTCCEVKSRRCHSPCCSTRKKRTRTLPCTARTRATSASPSSIATAARRPRPPGRQRGKRIPTIGFGTGEPSRMWSAPPTAAADDPDRTLAYGQRAQSSDDDTMGMHVERPRPATLPLAVTLVFGLLVGFAAGYAVADRDKTTNPPSAASAAPPAAGTPAVPPPGQRQSGGKAYSEQTLARPPATQPSGRGETPAPIAAPAEGAGRGAGPAATTGRLVVTSTPSKAGVLVNGKWRGRTPLTLNGLKFGLYTVRVVQPGLPQARQDVRLTAAEPVQSMAVRLERGASRPSATGRAEPPAASGGAAAPPPASSPSRAFAGSIYIDSRPRGARALIDGRAAGTTPVLVPDVAIGSHVVRLELADHRAWTAARASRPARKSASPDRSNGYDESHTRARKRHLVRRGRGRRRRRDRRRSRLQHQHDRLSGSADRPVVRRADRHDDVRREIGNYGVSADDGESRGAAGGRASSSATSRRSPATGAPTARCATTWSRHNIVAISDIDTRALTRVLRSAGVMRGIIATGDVDPRALVERARDARADGGRGPRARRHLRRRRSTGSRRRPRRASSRRSPERAAERPLRVAAYDFGMKWNILRRFTAYGCDVRVFPGDGAGVRAAGDRIPTASS